MKYIYTILAILVTLSISTQLCHANSISNAVIVVGEDAIPAEKTAANELAAYLKQITGSDFRITNSAAATDKPRIFIGQTAVVKSLLPGFDWSKLTHDGIIIKTVGNDLVLAGDRPRGAIYAVYTFLEDTLGVHWWTPSETYVPQKKTITIKPIDYTYTPQFRYRETYYQSVVSRNPEFANRLKINGMYQAVIPEDRGGHVWMIGGCHTFYQLLPSDIYFKDHPEWYSEINGQRKGTEAQLCLSNPEMRKELTRRAIEWVKGSPEAGMISISQNDYISFCTCDKCKELLKTTGSQSGTLIWFVNQVAEDIEKVAPNFLVDTIAYQYTQAAPTTIKPRRNVLIRLCSIECNFGFPIASKENARFYKDLTDWRKLTDKLFIWDYTVNFANLQVPHPNILNLGPNIRTFAANNVLGMFAQGDGYNPDMGFAGMKNWVLAHLLWNPKADDRKLIKEFLQGYYGPAAPHLWDYIVATQNAVWKQKPNLACFNSDYTFYTTDQLKQAYICIQKARASVKTNPLLSRRVEIQCMTFDHLLLINRARLYDHKWASNIKWKNLADNFLNLSTDTGNIYLSEGALMSPLYRTNLLHLGNTPVKDTPTTPPAACKGLTSNDWSEIQDSSIWLYQENNLAVKTADLGTSDGRACVVTGATRDWVVTGYIQDKNILTRKMKCYAVVKVIGKAKTGKAFSLGSYDRVAGRTIEKEILLDDIKDQDYHEYYLGELELNHNMTMYVAPPGNADAVDSVWVDRFFMVAVK